MKHLRALILGCKGKNPVKSLHLLCNAHIDPAWLWELEEGAGEALSTFRIAADFCDQFDGFIFNHNEVLLYQWVEQLDPALFKRIQKLVDDGKWHIIGGWYLQPDCNLPSGESFVRQIIAGRSFFDEKFGKRPSTAINFDSFGHTRGLVQILAKSGFDSYIFCRPDQNDCPLPDEDFEWVGYDGSRVMGHRAFGAYLSGKGKAREKVEKWMEQFNEEYVGLVLWGIGNHGGGPSRIDLTHLQALKTQTSEYNVIHSTPETYFAELKAKKRLPEHEKDLNPWAPGCYTSQIRIKQKHRELENAIFVTEKMVSSAAVQGFIDYPKQEIRVAIEDLLTAQFHDILAGTSIKTVENNALRLMDHGLEITAREKLKAFFALTEGQPAAKDGEVPVFVYNPHPVKIKTMIECEFQLPKSSKDHFANLEVFVNGIKIPSQVEKEDSNLYIDWRKRVVFAAELEPSQMNRFDCKVELLPEKPSVSLVERDGTIDFKTEALEVVINTKTGLIDKYAVNGEDFLKPGAFKPIVIQDDEDSWGSHVKSFPNQIDEFTLMSAERATEVSGVTDQELKAVRVVEDGDVRSVIEVLFEYNDSYICQTYQLPKDGTEIEVELDVFWLEKDKMLKLSVPSVFSDGKYIGQTAFGSEELPGEGKESVSQKWSCLVSDQNQLAFSSINDGIYGSDEKDGEIRLSLLRSPGYSALIGGNKNKVIPQDRFARRIDQGERAFKFWFNGSESTDRIEKIDLEALHHNEKPYVLSYFPSGKGELPKPLIEISDPSVQLAAFKLSEQTDHYIIRLFNPLDQDRRFDLSFPFLDFSERLYINRFEVKTYRLDLENKSLAETNLLEEPVQGWEG